MILSSILFKLDRICASLDTSDLFMLLHKATLESVNSVQKAFAYLQISNVQRVITKVVQKKICCNSLFIFNLPSQDRILSDNKSKLQAIFRKIALEIKVMPDLQSNTIKENKVLSKLHDQNKMHCMAYQHNLLKSSLKRYLVIEVNEMKNYVKA